MATRKYKRIDGSEPPKKWFWSLTGVFFLCLFSYGFLVRGAIVNIVARQNMGAELSNLNSQVLDLESEYIKLEKGITPEYAQSLGFIPVSGQKFVTKDAKTSGLSVLTNGI